LLMESAKPPKKQLLQSANKGDVFSETKHKRLDLTLSGTCKQVSCKGKTVAQCSLKE